jgi:hypothetical protein
LQELVAKLNVDGCKFGGSVRDCHLYYFYDWRLQRYANKLSSLEFPGYSRGRATGQAMA